MSVAEFSVNVKTENGSVFASFLDMYVPTRYSILSSKLTNSGMIRTCGIDYAMLLLVRMAAEMSWPFHPLGYYRTIFGVSAQAGSGIRAILREQIPSISCAMIPATACHSNGCVHHCA